MNSINLRDANLLQETRRGFHRAVSLTSLEISESLPLLSIALTVEGSGFVAYRSQKYVIHCRMGTYIVARKGARFCRVTVCQSVMTLP